MPPVPVPDKPPEPEAPPAETAIHSRPLPAGQQGNLRIPLGWLDTPSYHQPWGVFVPIKVPLGAAYNHLIPPEKRFSPGMVMRMLHNPDQGTPVGMVLDFTRSQQYYQTEEWYPEGHRNDALFYRKFPMQGRGAVPDPEQINEIVWLVINFMRQNPGQWIVLHCTHGFNRTGYVLASIMLRITMSLRVKDAVLNFARVRPPGIYKEDYIATLFDYYHELRTASVGKPAPPPWKDEDEEAGGLRPDDSDDEAAAPPPLAHDDVIGEAIHWTEERDIKLKILEMVKQANPEMQDAERFPGSQPVSLARSNLGLLRRTDRYHVSWKADGTRYLLLLCQWGAYVIDRSYRIRRVQLRAPTVGKPHMHKQFGPLQPVHHYTLLDGEMVVDTDGKVGTQRRRYLAYDCLALNSQAVVQRSFATRIRMSDAEVVAPREKERKLPGFSHQYHLEPFSILPKKFWALPAVEKALSFMANLQHESDGLIFQPSTAPYKAGTHEELLKWKFASMNSVDFLLRKDGGDFGQYKLHLMRPGKGQGADPIMVPLKDAKYVLPEGSDVLEFANRVIECSWDAENETWRYMRHRLDKETPNAYRVYEKVVQSIVDNITEEEVVEFIKHPPQGPPTLQPPPHLQPPPPGAAPGGAPSEQAKSPQPAAP